MAPPSGLRRHRQLPVGGATSSPHVSDLLSTLDIDFVNTDLADLTLATSEPEAEEGNKLRRARWAGSRSGGRTATLNGNALTDKVITTMHYT